MIYKISQRNKTVNCEVELPMSKSISNRLIILYNLYKHKYIIDQIADSNDSIRLNNLIKSQEKKLDVEDSGASLRFLISYFSIQVGRTVILDGNERIRKRPILELVNALLDIGADIKFLKRYGYAPVQIIGKKLIGNEITIDLSKTSQYVSSLIMIAPKLENGLSISLRNNHFSKSYILMTLKLMTKFGLKYKWDSDKIIIKKQKIVPYDIVVEKDWSASSFWMLICSLAIDSEILLKKLTYSELQGDSIVFRIAEHFGVKMIKKGNDILMKKIKNFNELNSLDIKDFPDIFLPISILIEEHNLKTKVYGIETQKFKESDRVLSFQIGYKNIKQKKIISTFYDHRVAMSFAALAINNDFVLIENPDVVKKSYVNFWKDLKKADFKIMKLTHQDFLSQN
ncbi:hypothetical protein OA863_01720 [Bacteroidota bacterium]|nr:hypothetical protein [Bacteroidota bacterium]